MSLCGYCKVLTSSRKPPISCHGTCKKQYHASCIGVPAEMAPLFTSVPGLSWKCKDCVNVDLNAGETKIEEILERKCTTFFNEISVKLESMKSEITKTTCDKISQLPLTQTSSSSPTYAEKLRAGSQPKIIIKPKNRNQQNETTKSDILSKVNPVEEEICVNKVRHISNGGILLGCNNADEVCKLKKLAEEKLSDNYEIRELKNVYPRIRVVGMTCEFNEEVFLQYMKKQNDGIFNSSSECKLINFCPTKNKRSIFQATLQVDVLTYKKVIEAGKLFIGLDSCTVYEAFYLPRCFKCNSYNHTAKFCRSDLSCPLCAGNHEYNSCSVSQDQYKCVNCCSIKEKQKIDIDVKHAVWNYGNCSAYKQEVNKLKRDVFGSNQ